MTDAGVVEVVRTSTVRRIKGPTISLGSGGYFDFEHPEAGASGATIEDIAWGLAGCARFAGQTIYQGRRCLYTVAQHCTVMSQAVPPALAYAALMHELGEAVCGDMTGPLKSICPDYKVVEKRCAAALEMHFRVPAVDQVELKRWDLRMLATERRDMMPWAGEEWSPLAGVEPLNGTISPLTPSLAAEGFLARYRALAAQAAPAQGEG